MFFTVMTLGHGKETTHFGVLTSYAGGLDLILMFYTRKMLNNWHVDVKISQINYID